MADAAEEQVESDEESSEEIDDAQKMKIANHFVKSSCAGEQVKVIDHLKYFLGDIYTDENVKQHLISRAENACEVVDGTVIAAETKQGDGYINSVTGKVVTFKVGKNQLVKDSEEDAELSDDVKSLQDEVSKYVKSQYHQSANRGSAVVTGDEGTTVIISADIRKPDSYWNGQMNSKYTITEAGKLSGTIVIKLHYYEGGNVVFDANKEFAWKDQACKTPKEIVNAIKTLETEYEKALSLYLNSSSRSDQSSGGVFSIRRALTIQGTKMKWNLNSAKLAKGG
jgi:hypothetical protein